MRVGMMTYSVVALRRLLRRSKRAVARRRAGQKQKRTVAMIATEMIRCLVVMMKMRMAMLTGTEMRDGW